uniref:Uncharacterized protein n=1 Tax=Cyprinus carpio TaxID=7962 RepID=A0A8C2L0M2_CYPCA
MNNCVVQMNIIQTSQCQVLQCFLIIKSFNLFKNVKISLCLFLYLGPTTSSLCLYWYNIPCNSATTQTPYWTMVYYQTQTPFWPIQNEHHSDVPVPSNTVFRQTEDRERVLVMCSFGRRLTESCFQLSLKSEYNYALKNPRCFSNDVCVFDVKVSPPVSFTCVHQINSVVNRQSETYTYSLSDPHYEGVSSFYIGFFSFIAVGLVIMTAAVIMTTVKSKAKGVCFIQTHFHV